jgi:hypothetical protein
MWLAVWFQFPPKHPLCALVLARTCIVAPLCGTALVPLIPHTNCRDHTNASGDGHVSEVTGPLLQYHQHPRSIVGCRLRGPSFPGPMVTLLASVVKRRTYILYRQHYTATMLNVCRRPDSESGRFSLSATHSGLVHLLKCNRSPSSDYILATPSLFGYR